MSSYSGAFPPPPEDPPVPTWSPPAAPVEPPPAPEPEAAAAEVVEAAPAPVVRGRLGTFRFDLPDERGEADEPDERADADADADDEGVAGPGDDGDDVPVDEETDAPTLPFDLLVFDFAGLLVSSPIPAVAALAPTLGVDPPKLLDIVFGPYATADSDHPYHRLERNEITASAYDEHLQAQGAELGIELDLERIRPVLLGVDVNEVVVEYIIDRRAEGFRTALISNMTKEVALAWKQMLPLGELFDLVVDSASVGIRKPNPVIYRQVLHQLGVEPARAVLLDDTLGNVEGARSVGMAGIHVVRDPSIGLKQLNVLMGREDADEEE